MKWSVSSFSDKGPRASNEDSLLISIENEQDAWIGVADGLGGHFGGSIASSFATNALLTILDKPDSGLLHAFLKIHEDLRRQQASDSALHNMATTLTVARLGGRTVYGAHCGDTRCVVARGNGIRKLSVEHTEAQRLLDAGKLTKAEWVNYPRRNILDSALGASNEPKIDEFQFDAKVGDWIIITSDGVHELIKLREMRAIIDRSNSPIELVEETVRVIKHRGPEDNYSIVCARAE